MFGHKGAAQVEFHESSRSGHHHVGAGFQFSDLGLGADTSNQGQCPNVCVRSETANGLSHLKGQLLGWNQHHDARFSVLSSLQFLQKRKDKCGRLAGACLGDPNQILACKNPRDGLHLNLRGLHIP